MAEEIIFKVGVDTGNTDQKLDKVESGLSGVDKSTENLNKSSKELNKELYKVGAKFDEIYGELQPLSSRLGEIEDRMYELALAGRQNTEEFRTLQEEVVRYRKTIIETDRAVDLLAEQGKGLGTALQIGSAITAGYGAVQGSMAMLGMEGEELEKTMVKLQAVQAVLNSLEQIKITLDQRAIILSNIKLVGTKALTAAEVIYATAIGGTTGAMKALRIAMLAIPIVAIIAGIVALVAAVASLWSEEEKAEAQNEALTKSYERQEAVFNRAMASRQRATEMAIKLAKARGASDEEIHQMEIDQIKENEALRREQLNNERDIIQKRKKAYQQALKEGNEDLAKEIKGEIEQHKNKYRDLKSLDGDYLKEIELKNTEFNEDKQDKQDEADQKAADAAKAAAEKAKQRREEEQKKRLEQERLLQDLIVANIADASDREIAELALKHKREQEEIVSKYGKNAELIAQLELKQQSERDQLAKEQKEKQDALDKERLAEEQKQAEKLMTDRKARLEAELLAIEEDFYAQQELEKQLAQIEMEEALLNQELTEGEKLKIHEEYAKKTRDIDKATAEHEKKLQEDVTQAKLDITQQSLQLVQNITELFGKKNERAAKIAFNIDKAAKISSATIAGIEGTINAYKTAQGSPITTLFPAYPIIQAGLAAGFAATNIAKIAQTQFGGSGSGAVQAPSANAQTQGAGNVPQAPTPSTLTAGLPGATEAPTNKVIVVDSEITGKQKSTAKAEALATYGG